jgi:hypothetical protein
MENETENQWESCRVCDRKRRGNEEALSWRETFEFKMPEIWEATKDSYQIEEILPGDDDPSPWDRWCARVFSALKNPVAPLPEAILRLTVPQSGCCFSFGADKSPLPAGAMLRLWEKDPTATGECPLCQGEVVATAFGGLLSTGGYQGRCLKCAAPMFKFIGGLGSVHHHVQAFLEGTPWHVSGARFGGSVTADGKALAEALGQRKPPRARRPSGVSMKVGGHTFPPQNVEIVEGK